MPNCLKYSTCGVIRLSYNIDKLIVMTSLYGLMVARERSIVSRLNLSPLEYGLMETSRVSQLTLRTPDSYPLIVWKIHI